jgi:hypothetical protein
MKVNVAKYQDDHPHIKQENTARTRHKNKAAQQKPQKMCAQ